uniref:Cytochrome b5 heme-binding domain-containing protein n=1 Tax=Plectus sambesii TaxID=2011161 RepID=A0A914XPJ9_9BILA
MAKAPLYTRGLAYAAVQTAFVAFLFSYYNVEIPLPDLTPARHWLYDRIDELDWFDFILHYSAKLRSAKKTDKHSATSAKDPIIISPEQLAKYDGSKGSKGLYLSILGKVYNVEKGAKHYGPGGSYHFFTGSYSVDHKR